MPTPEEAAGVDAGPPVPAEGPLPTDGAVADESESVAPSSEPVVPLVFLDKPPLDPRVLRNVMDSYEGETTRVLQCDLPVYHGHGKAVFKTGFTYEGAFHYGRMHGHGRIEWATGVVYEGALVDNEIQGHGSYWWPNGSSYTGDVASGKRHGRGVFYTGTRGTVSLPADEDATESHDSTQAPSQPLFPLQFAFHDSETSDSINTVSCARYEGQWVDGLPHGKGVLVFDDDQLVRYEGDFVMGKRHGKGEMRYASGNVYTGDWRDDVKCGHGTILWMGSTGGAVEKYDGAWRDDRPQGHGRHVWLTSASVTTRQREKNWYEGQFQEGVRHGLGAFYYANGARYEGEWVDNIKHGRGVFYYEDGRVFVGEFRVDRAVESTNASLNNGAVGTESATTATPNASKILLFVDDLLPSPPARDKARKLIEHAVLRINTELRALYRQYLPQPPVGSPNSRMSVSPVHVKPSEDGGDADGAGGATLMEYYECRRLLADGGVRLSGGQLDLLLQQIRLAQRRATIPAELEDTPAVPEMQRTDPVTLAASMPEVVPPARLLLFREFIELLVRLAHHQARGQDPEDDDGDAVTASGIPLADTFVAFYEQLTRDRQRQGKSFEPVVTPLHQLYTKELHSVYQKHHSVFQRLFAACKRPSVAKNHEPEEPNEEDEDLHKSPDAVKIKEMLGLLKDHALLLSPSFRARHAIDALEAVFALEEDRGSDPFFVDTSLVFTDFLDALAVLLLAKQAHESQQEPQATVVPLVALVDELAHAIPASL